VAGLPDAWDAASSSNSLLMSGDGWMEFMAPSAFDDVMCGLAIGANSTTSDYGDISFAVNLRADGALYIRQSGALDPVFVPIAYAPGDRIRVEVVGGNQVRYSRNGTPFHMHAAAIAYPIRVDASLYRSGSTIADARSSF
jgi:hypothetical protein